MDFEAWETGLRAVVLAAGARLLEEMLSGMGTGRQADGVLCLCGTRMQSVGIRPKKLMTILGEVKLSRSWFVCPKCGEGRAVLDEALDIAGTGFSPGLRRLMARAGSRETFKNGAEDLKVYAEITVTAKEVERISEGTGEAVLDWQKREQANFLSEKGAASLLSMSFPQFLGGNLWFYDKRFLPETCRNDRSLFKFTHYRLQSLIAQ
ncbi:MAG: hypothetical protein AAB035_04315 [Nitrospirota bacterium]